MYIKRIRRETDSVKELLLGNGCAVALGVFDGLHKGHMKLVREMQKYADGHRLKTCVFTFDSNIGNTPYITSNEQREKLLRSKSIDLFVMRTFTDEFRQLSPEQFFEKYIIEKLDARMIVVGFNYRFGRGRGGGSELLEHLCGKRGIKLTIIPPVLYMNSPVSSTRIRLAVESGNLKAAADMLGRDFRVMSDVVHGDSMGGKMGFPTANMSVDKNHVMPPKGVYATVAEVDGHFRPAVTNYGGKPTVKEGTDLIETHIMGFEGSLYGNTIEVSFVKKIRDIQKFDSVNDLSSQLERDKEQAKEILDKHMLLC